MTKTMIEPDTRGVDALTGDMPDSMPELPLLIWEGLVADLGELPDTPHIDPFDEQPWQQLPTIEDLEELWCASPLATIMMHRLAIKTHGERPDLPLYMAGQWQLAETELMLKKGREDDERRQAVDIGGSGGDAAVEASASRGGGAGAARGSKNGDKVGTWGKTKLGKDSRRSQAVSRRGGVANGAGSAG